MDWFGSKSSAHAPLCLPYPTPLREFLPVDEKTIGPLSLNRPWGLVQAHGWWAWRRAFVGGADHKNEGATSRMYLFAPSGSKVARSDPSIPVLAGRE